MLHLSTKEVVLSIEKAELEIKHGIIYQKYPNFFGNTFDFDFGKKENFEKLENQTHLNRLKLSKDDEVMKKLTVFFMNSSITQALEKKLVKSFIDLKNNQDLKLAVFIHVKSM